MSIFNKGKKGGISDVIRCDEKDYLIWKWHPNKYEEGSLKRETAIRTNSVLRVKNGEVAVFFYRQKDGTLEDYIEGPYEDKIKTKNFPILSSIIGLWYEKDTPFQAEIFFINTSRSQQVKFGIPFFNIVDPRFMDFEVPVAVRGSVTFQLSDYKAFVRCHQLATFTYEDLCSKINDTVIMLVKEAVAKAPKVFNIPVINIESKLYSIRELCEETIKQRLEELYGVKVHGVDISAIEIDKDSESYLELKSITKDITRRQTEANILNYEEQLRIQREEGQFAQHMRTGQENLSAYQSTIQAEVGIAGAEALGKMGENGAGNINMGGNAGFNPMTMMAGMALGNAVGQNISGTLNQSMNPSSSNMTPPPVSKTTYYVAKDGNSTGPYELNDLSKMVLSGNLKKDDLVWTKGMADWTKCKDVKDISELFPPDIPNVPTY